MITAAGSNKETNSTINQFYCCIYVTHNLLCSTFKAWWKSMWYIMHVADEDEKQHGFSCDVCGQFVVGLNLYTLTFSDCVDALQGVDLRKTSQIVYWKWLWTYANGTVIPVMHDYLISQYCVHWDICWLEVESVMATIQNDFFFSKSSCPVIHRLLFTTHIQILMI